MAKNGLVEVAKEVVMEVVVEGLENRKKNKRQSGIKNVIDDGTVDKTENWMEVGRRRRIK